VDVVDVVEAVVDDLRDVVLDARLRGLEGGAALHLLGAAVRLAARELEHRQPEQGEEGADEDDEHHRDALLVPKPLSHESALLVTLVE
jgi:hypothetical protein